MKRARHAGSLGGTSGASLSTESSTWVVTVAGIYLSLADARAGKPLPSAGAFTAQLVLGWGWFNLVEGIVDHQILDLHHVRDLPTHVPLYDWLFLIIGGVGFVLAGWAASREHVR